MVDITYEYATVLYNSADVEYDGGQKDSDKWAIAQEFDVGTDVTTSTGSGDWSVVGTRAAGGSFANPFTQSYPVGTLAGDLLYYGWINRPSTGALVTPTGWSKGPTNSVSGGGQVWETVSFYRIAGTETSVTITTNGTTGSCVLVAFRNSGLLSTATLAGLANFDGDRHFEFDTASGGTLTVGSSANALAANLAIYIVGINGGGSIWTDPSGVTLARRITDGGGGTTALGVLYEQSSTDFPSRVWTVTWSAGGAHLLASRTVVDEPLGGHEVDAWQVIP